MSEKIISVFDGRFFDAINRGDVVMFSVTAWDEHKPFVEDVAVGDLFTFSFEGLRCVVSVEGIEKREMLSITEDEARLHGYTLDWYRGMMREMAGMSKISDVWIIRFARFEGL